MFIREIPVHDHAHNPAPPPQSSACGHGDGHVCGHGSLGVHHPATDAVCLQNVSYAYRRGGNGASGGSALALRDVTLHVERGCNLGIIGPNGAGKTTLIKIILGLIEGYTGSVSVMGMSPRQACRAGGVVGYVPQRHDVEWRFPITASQAVLMGLTGKTGLFRRFSRGDREHALRMMDEVGVAHLAQRPVGDLSGGQQQRVFIARALAARPSVLILDEPLVGVDEAGQRQFSELIHKLHESLKLTVIIVSHDIQAIAAGCNRVACLKQSIHYHDAPSGLTPQVLREVFTHEITPVLGRE